MKARLIFRKRQRHGDGLIEMVIWQLPGADADRPRGIKHRLVYIREGQENGDG